MEQTINSKPKVVIAGATGFIGRWFIEEFKEKYDFIGLSRGVFDTTQQQDGIEWRQVDLYSLTSSTQAIEGADYAIYLGALYATIYPFESREI